MLPVCKRYAGSREDAQDYLQEAFIKVFEKLHLYRFEGSLEGWIRTTVVHICLNKLRSRKLYSDLSDDFPVMDTSMPDGIQNMSEQDLLAQIAALPVGYRTVFNLFAIDGYDHAEIAEMLEISESTSRSQLTKARMVLRKALTEKKTDYSHVDKA
jgi:RNA polymerase sigma factor (sigma-70 family)